MIIIRLHGGLGNQLFQLTAALHLQARNNMQINFYVDHLKNYETPRKFMLKEILPKEVIWQFAKPNWFVQTILKYRINKVFPFFFKWSITHKNITSVKPCSFYVIDDYFQDISMFYDQINIVTAYINSAANSNKKVLSIYNSNGQFQNTVALHIRRGDYVNEKYSKILVTQPNEYYKNAIFKVGRMVESILVFTNDEINDIINIDKMPYTLSQTLNLNDVEEFLLMSKFTKLIIANSTYSFWAAIAASKAICTTDIIAPKNWFYNVADNQIWLKNLNIFNIETV